MVIGGVPGPSLDVGDLPGLLDSYTRAGIKSFLFPGSLAREPERLSAEIVAARRATERAGLGRALVAIGGFASPSFGLPFFPEVPSPLGLASLGSSRAARRSGRVVGARLAACGVDMVMGPRLDLASDPKDPFGALEGFGEDARLVGLLGSAYSRGLEGSGVHACAGRFPGLGATCRDCYEGANFIALPVERLERCEMRPFMRASASGVAAVLVGKVLVPSLESERIPASMSARVIEGRLREELRFRGVVVADDVGEEDDPGRSAVLEALAGCDLCVFSRPDQARAAAEALAKAASGGELPSIRTETARRRVEKLIGKSSRPGPARCSPAELSRASRDIGSAVSLLRGSLVVDGAKDGNFSGMLSVVFLPPAGAPDAAEADAVAAAIREAFPGSELLTFPSVPLPSDGETALRVLSSGRSFKEAVIFTYDAHFHPAQESLAKLAVESLPRFRVVAMRDPYDAAFFPRAIGLGAAYGFSGACARAASLVLAGKRAARGGHPVEVIGLEI